MVTSYWVNLWSQNEQTKANIYNIIYSAHETYSAKVLKCKSVDSARQKLKSDTATKRQGKFESAKVSKCHGKNGNKNDNNVKSVNNDMVKFGNKRGKREGWD